MLTFFNFLYLLVYRWYSRYEKVGAEGSAIFAVSGFQVLNLLSVYFIYNYLEKQKPGLPVFVFIVVYFLLLVFNYFQYIYKDSKIAVVKDKWEKLDDRLKLKWEGWLIVYIIFSICFLFVSAIF